MARLTHTDDAGRAAMVDVSRKRATRRRASASATVRFNAKAYRALREDRLAKGDALAVARLAGIQAAKRTAELIPLCHQVPLEDLAVAIELDDDARTAHVRAEALATWRTGVEMEALTAVSAAALALYDMAKGLDRAIVIEQVRLDRKSGGRSGSWRRR